MNIIEVITDHVRKYNPSAVVTVVGDMLKIEVVQTASFGRGESFGVSHDPITVQAVVYNMGSSHEVYGRLSHMGLTNADLACLRDGTDPFQFK